MARKCHCCKQTIINHIRTLIGLHIIEKRVIWIKGNRCEINTYTFRIAWDKRPAHMCHSQDSGQNLPPQEREKDTSVREDLERQRKGIRFLMPGTERWQAVADEIARLEGLLAQEGCPTTPLD
jgi:hypothetical protein